MPQSSRIVAVAGMFNTGTNFLETQLRKNLLHTSSLWQVPWGKHRLANTKWNHTAKSMEQYTKQHVLPVVVIRHPLVWLHSMCKSPYAAKWRHTKRHCPNLIFDDEFPKSTAGNAVPVSVKFDEQHVEHFDSLVGLWNDWYRMYLAVDYPILMGTLCMLVYIADSHHCMLRLT